MTSFTKIGVAGDWHGNTQWAVSAINQMCEKLEDQTQAIILQLGDFGIWRKNDRYQKEISKALDNNDALLYFIDGNHENHPLLAKYLDSKRRKLEWETSNRSPESTWPFWAGDRGDWDIPNGVEIEEWLYWLPRGSRWEWHGKKWLAVGGAVSVDQNWRREGFDWFPEEVISQTQKRAIIARGPADVMITHDCPDFYHPYDESNPYGFNWGLLAKAREHAQLLQEIVEAVQPSYLMHGHYHRHYQTDIFKDWGTLNLTGLHCDGTQGNWYILDLEKMEWVL